MWKVGDRVLARRRPEAYWYPGTVRHIDGARHYVIFEDGEDGFALGGEMISCRFTAGDRVEVYQAAANNYLPARVAEAGPDSVRVRYLNQEEQAVPLSKVRVHPELWKQIAPTAEEAAARNWKVCDRVLACWYDLDWYPGVVLGAESGGVRVLFDTGSQALLPPVKVLPFRLAAGEPVLCRRRAGPDYYSGKVADLDGERVRVQYDDGTAETTTVRLLRLRRDEWLPTGPGLRAQPGYRVMAQAHDLLWYPGVLRAAQGRRLQVAYDDGEQGLVTPDQIRPVDIGAGSRVQCRRGNGPRFVPARVIERDRDRLRVAYDDGGEEWTTLRMVRVER